MKITAIIPAAGLGSRYSDKRNKLFEEIKGVPVIVRTLTQVAKIKNINNIIICASSEIIENIKKLIKKYNILKICAVIRGGANRQESVYLGLKHARQFNFDFVLIHDGARPLISTEIIQNSINLAVKNGASIVAVPVKDTIKRVSSQTKEVIDTLNRDELWSIQTPQVFNHKQILEAHETFKGRDFTDDSALLEKLNIPVSIVMGSYKNIKITTEEDLKIAEMFMS